MDARFVAKTMQDKVNRLMELKYTTKELHFSYGVGDILDVARELGFTHHKERNPKDNRFYYVICVPDDIK